ncbi:MAG: glycosyltransferase family 4 protein [Usitatibacteraceae bacterium]
MNSGSMRNDGPTDQSAIKVDIVVHGRFHGFALARALLAQGHDVVVHTNYPKSVVARFGVPPDNVRSFLTHGIAARAFNRMGRLEPRTLSEPALHRAFGLWAARSLRPETDLVYAFTGISEELLRLPRSNPRQLRMIVRGSAHIREQARLLEEEEARLGIAIDRPSQWMIDREEREYALADQIVTLSNFAFESFVVRGMAPERLINNPLGVDTARFSSTSTSDEARQKRIIAGNPLNVLTVGTLSAQKGAADLAAVASRLHNRVKFAFVGTAVWSELAPYFPRDAGTITLNSRVPEDELSRFYSLADIFVFPTIQDGFAAVLLQAAAAGLPIIATTNCSAPDFVVEGETGWIVPIRDPDAIVRRLIWCDENRTALAQMARAATAGSRPRTWDAMARELIAHYQRIQAETEVRD